MYFETVSIFLYFIYSEGPENNTFIFLSTECKSSWEAYIDDAKKKLGKLSFL
jgi:hypothetical protein